MNITCPTCHAHFSITSTKKREPPKFCAYCQSSLPPPKAPEEEKSDFSFKTNDETSIVFIEEHLPQAESIQFTIGPYQIINNIGSGGMGEVFLAYDTSCGRRIALKRIRPDLITHKQLHNRFLREALITSQLTHPAIIPIYTIQKEPDLAYYTMPFVEGETLKQILSHAKQQERKGHKPEHASSISALLRHYLAVCQGVAYAHSKQVIHRDLKPNNIIVGRYGEVLILDWGLARLVTSTPNTEELTLEEDDDLELEKKSNPADMTHMGRVVGTVAYMAPERALGNPATFQTDLYSLGVVLYQILTLRHPFHRTTLQEFRQEMSKEVLVDPGEVAPYRDVPPALSKIALKCLSPSLEERYHSVDELINDLEIYIEGRSDWFKVADLDINRKADWEFQENVLIAEHIAITRGTDESNWVSLMISKASFAENTKIEAKVRIKESGHGVGFLLSVPEPAERTHPNDGYCLWLSSDLDKSTKLLRSNVEVISAPDTFLQRDVWYQVRIEKIENNIHFYLNDTLQFSYISHLPIGGTHVGLLARDADFSLQELSIYVGSQSIKVNCLAVPDAFLAHNNYSVALSEYRRIGYAFPGTAEGREALFRAGITLLEEARACQNPEETQKKSEEALEEFSKLHNTPGAPLGYLGKALVYQALGDYEEEIKCFEMAYRRYPKHPLLPILHEQLIYRMHDSSRYDRKSTYQFILLAVRYLPSSTLSYNAKKLFNSLKHHWEPLYFISLEGLTHLPEGIQKHIFAIQLAFWLAKPHTIAEIIDELLEGETIYIKAICSGLFALLVLNEHALAREKLATIKMRHPAEVVALQLIEIAFDCRVDFAAGLKRLFTLLPSQLTKQELRVILYLMEDALEHRQPERVHKIARFLEQGYAIHADWRLKIDCCRIWAYLWEKNWAAAEEILHHYSLEQLTEETTYLHFLYGCWLYATEGSEIANIHFSSILEVAYPRSWTLFSHFVHGKHEIKPSWLRKAFDWEKRQLYRQFVLFYHCSDEPEKEQHYQHELDRM